MICLNAYYSVAVCQNMSILIWKRPLNIVRIAAITFNCRQGWEFISVQNVNLGYQRVQCVRLLTCQIVSPFVSIAHWMKMQSILIRLTTNKNSKTMSKKNSVIDYLRSADFDDLVNVWNVYSSEVDNFDEEIYPNDDATQRPLLQWRANSNNLFSNWLNYYVYQVTPYEL